MSQEMELGQTLSQSEVLEKRKTAIKNLIMEMVDSLPDMVKMIVKMNLTTVQLLVDDMTFEQTEELLTKAQNIIDEIRG